MKSCPVCGTQVNDELSFCPNCGAKFPQPETTDFAGQPAQPQTPYYTPVQDPVVPTPNYPTAQPAPAYDEPVKKSVYVPGLVLGIIAIVGGLLIALIGWICGTIGIILSAVNMKNPRYKAAPGLVTSIIGLVLSILSSILAVVLVNIYAQYLPYF